MAHPRRRAGFISLLAAAVVIPFGLRFSLGTGAGSGIPLPPVMAFAGIFIGLVLANQFGNDGAAYAMHVLAGVPGQAELRSRAVALGLLTLPLLTLACVVVAVITDGVGQLAAALGTVVASFGASMGIAGLTSVLVPYALPDSTNPFAVNSGGGGAKGLLSLVSLLAAMVCTAPVIVGYFLLPVSARWVLLPVGVAWGLGAGWLGTYAGGAVLDRRAPEVLAAVTPGR